MVRSGKPTRHQCRCHDDGALADRLKMRKFETNEILKLLDVMVGSTEPVADSAIDEKVNDNLMVLIDVINWCLDGVYDAARHRKSDYASQREIGERAYSAILEWEEWLKQSEDELA